MTFRAPNLDLDDMLMSREPSPEREGQNQEGGPSQQQLLPPPPQPQQHHHVQPPWPIQAPPQPHPAYRYTPYPQAQAPPQPFNGQPPPPYPAPQQQAPPPRHPYGYGGEGNHPFHEAYYEEEARQRRAFDEKQARARQWRAAQEQQAEQERARREEARQRQLLKEQKARQEQERMQARYQAEQEQRARDRAERERQIRAQQEQARIAQEQAQQQRPSQQMEQINPAHNPQNLARLHKMNYEFQTSQAMGHQHNMHGPVRHHRTNEQVQLQRVPKKRNVPQQRGDQNRVLDVITLDEQPMEQGRNQPLHPPASVQQHGHAPPGSTPPQYYPGNFPAPQSVPAHYVIPNPHTVHTTMLVPPASVMQNNYAPQSVQMVPIGQAGPSDQMGPPPQPEVELKEELDEANRQLALAQNDVKTLKDEAAAQAEAIEKLNLESMKKTRTIETQEKTIEEQKETMETQAKRIMELEKALKLTQSNVEISPAQTGPTPEPPTSVESEKDLQIAQIEKELREEAERLEKGPHKKEYNYMDVDFEPIKSIQVVCQAAHQAEKNEEMPSTSSAQQNQDAQCSELAQSTSHQQLPSIPAHVPLSHQQKESSQQQPPHPTLLYGKHFGNISAQASQCQSSSQRQQNRPVETRPQVEEPASSSSSAHRQDQEIRHAHARSGSLLQPIASAPSSNQPSNTTYYINTVPLPASDSDEDLHGSRPLAQPTPSAQLMNQDLHCSGPLVPEIPFAQGSSQPQPVKATNFHCSGPLILESPVQTQPFAHNQPSTSTSSMYAYYVEPARLFSPPAHLANEEIQILPPAVHIKMEPMDFDDQLPSTSGPVIRVKQEPMDVNEIFTQQDQLPSTSGPVIRVKPEPMDFPNNGDVTYEGQVKIVYQPHACRTFEEAVAWNEEHYPEGFFSKRYEEKHEEKFEKYFGSVDLRRFFFNPNGVQVIPQDVENPRHNSQQLYKAVKPSGAPYNQQIWELMSEQTKAKWRKVWYLVKKVQAEQKGQELISVPEKVKDDRKPKETKPPKAPKAPKPLKAPKKKFGSYHPFLF